MRNRKSLVSSQKEPARDSTGMPLSVEGRHQVFGAFLDDYTTAFLLAAAILTVPSFFVNKHFVWRVRSAENLRFQVLVYSAALIPAVSLATLFTYLIENAAADQTVLVRGTAAFFAQMLGFGIVWVGRFLMLDRWLFKIAGDTSSTLTRSLARSRSAASGPPC